jgi:hypothetical protein
MEQSAVRIDEPCAGEEGGEVEHATGEIVHLLS